MTGAPLEMFKTGDLCRFRLDGKAQPGFYVYQGTLADGSVALRRQGYASPRYFKPERVELIDHDARWPT